MKKLLITIKSHTIKKADKGDIQAMIDYVSNLSKCEEGTFDKEEVIKYFKLAVDLNTLKSIFSTKNII